MKNFLKRIGEVFGLTKSATFTSISGGSLFSGSENILDASNLTSYKKSLYLYIGVNMVSKRVAGIIPDLFKIKNIKGEVEEVLSHDLLSLMKRPNFQQTRREFWELSVTYYLLAGESFWYLNRSENGKHIESMYTLRPDHLEIMLSTDGKEIIAYEYGEFGNKIVIKPEDMLHFKNVDPTNTIRGVGVVAPASSRIITEREASKYQSNFFANQGRPDVAIFLDRELTQEQSTEARATWKKIYGAGKGGQAGFFGSDVKKLETLNTTPKEMDFIASQNFLRDDILASLHIPKAMITSDDVNLANSKTALILYLTEAIIPVFETFLDIINNKFLSTIDDTLFLDYESPVPQDRELLIKELKDLTGDVYTQNESRELLGLPALEGGDEIRSVSIVQSMQTAETEKKAKNILKSRPLLYKRLKAIESVIKVIAESKKLGDVTRYMNTLFPTHESKQAYAKAFNDKIDKKTVNFKEILDGYHEELFKRIKTKNKDGYTTDNFMDKEFEKGEAVRKFKDFMTTEYIKNGQNSLNALFSDKKAVEQLAENFFITEAILGTIENRSEFFVGSMIDTTYNQLQSKIIAGIESGDGIDAIGRTLRAEFDGISVARGKTIARTETSWMLSSSTNDAYSQSEVVTGKEWITVGDANVRAEHQANSGVIVPKDSAFPSGEHFAGEHTINCRCVIAPTV